jgi:polyhydroxybutyrate depolymerase
MLSTPWRSYKNSASGRIGPQHQHAQAESTMWLLNGFLGWRARRRTRSLVVGGLTRTYVVHTPPDLDPQKPAPVVLALHGATMTGPLMAWFTKLNAKADAAGFIVVYPNGTGQRSSYFWNAGNCCGPAAQQNVDDVGFIRAVLDDLAATYRIDPERVFATGMSNGAMMAYRLASELSDRVAAVAPVAGTVTCGECRPTRPVPVLHIHGTEDEFGPFGGGRGAKSISGVDYRSVKDTIATWVRANNCREEPAAVEELPDRTGDGTKVTRTTYGGDAAGAEVVLVTVAGGGHTWPGRPGSAALGRSTQNVSANDLIWEFFERHPMG